MIVAIQEILLEYGYYVLLTIAIFLNRGNKPSLLLTMVVGLSALIPMQYIQNYYLWYGMCIGIEVGKIVLAYNLQTRIKYPIMFLCGLMLVCHLLSMYVQVIIPYKTILPALEHLEIASCALFSVPVLLQLKRKVRCLLK